MEIKKRTVRLRYAHIIIAAVLSLPCRALFAQQAGYFVDYGEGNPKFIQRFVWDRDEYALYYEVLIYVNDYGLREYSRDITEDNFFLVSLPPGRYSYCITPYDLLENRGETSQLIEFEILRAFQPVITGFAPQAFYLDQNAERVLRITGTNLFEESNIFLQSQTSFLYPQKIVIDNNREAALFFNDLELIPGDYNIFVKNPGGLDTSLGDFVIAYKKPMDFFLKVTWAPAIPVYGYMNDIIGRNFFPFGVSVNLETVSSGRGFFNGGIELAASIFFLSPVIPTHNDSDNFMSYLSASETFFTSVDFNFVLQKRFDGGKTAFSFRFGLGIVLLKGFEYFMPDTILLELNLGIDFFVRLFNNFYIDAGVDFNNFIVSGFSGIIKPRVGIVWQF